MGGLVYLVKMTKRRTIDDVYDICVKIEKHAIITNGRVTLNKWISTSALGVSCFAVVALVYVKYG